MYTDKSISYGILNGISLIVYFLLMKLLGLEENLMLRLFNFVIVATLIFLAHRSSYLGVEKTPGYVEGLFIGFRTGVIGVAIFIAFMGLYVQFIQPDFMQIIQKSQIWGNDLELWQVALAIAVEGVCSVAVISFASMQYFKHYITQVRTTNEG